MNIERWLPVVGYEGIYEVSDCGNVRRIADRPDGKRHKSGNRKLCVDKANGYIRFSLSDMQSNKKSMGIHTVVARAFLGPAPEGHEVNHKDGCKTNNVPDNLEYVTKLGNNQHARQVLHKNGPFGVQCRTAKINPDIVREIRAMRKQGAVLRVIAEKYGLAIPSVHHVCIGRSWKQVE